MAHVRRDLAQGARLRGGKHQVVPPGAGLDALRQVVQPRPGAPAAGVPQPRAHVAALGRQRLRAGQGDVARAQVELRHERVELPVQLRRGGPQRPAPHAALLVGRGLLHVQPHPGAHPGAQRLAGGGHHRRAHPLREGLRGTGRLGRIGIVHLQQQRAPAQHRFALPQPQHRVALGGQRGEVGGGGGESAQPQQRADLRGHRAARPPLRAAEEEHGEVALRPCPHPRRARGELHLRRRQRAGRGEGLHQRDQPLVDPSHAGQEVQDVLVDAQRRRREPVAGRGIHQPPVAQGGAGGQRAPVRAVQRGQRQPEGGRAPATHRAVRLRERPAHLHPRAQQEHVALKG
jgi:hypothetical protein